MTKYLLALLLLTPLAAIASDLSYKPSTMQVITPNADALGASSKNPASDVEVRMLIDALGVKESLKASIEATSPMVKQAYNDLLEKTMREQGVSLTPQMTQTMSTRLTEKYNKLKTAMFDWMVKEYVKRHQATYTQAETLQILTFMKSPVGQKYVKSDAQIWSSILMEANAEFVKLIPATVAQVFREAGALR